MNITFQVGEFTAYRLERVSQPPSCVRKHKDIIRVPHIQPSRPLGCLVDRTKRYNAPINGDNEHPRVMPRRIEIRFPPLSTRQSIYCTLTPEIKALLLQHLALGCSRSPEFVLTNKALHALHAVETMLALWPMPYEKSGMTASASPLDFFETSALAKRSHVELGTNVVRAAFDNAEPVRLTTDIALAVLTCLCRGGRIDGVH